MYKEEKIRFSKRASHLLRLFLLLHLLGKANFCEQLGTESEDEGV